MLLSLKVFLRSKTQIKVYNKYLLLLDIQMIKTRYKLYYPTL